MRKILLTIAFDGSDYEGWKSQRAERGVCHQIQQSFQSLTGEIPEIVSSSRTDSGVHALGLCAHVVIPEKLRTMAADKLTRALNAALPANVRILSSRDVPDSFHARFDVVEKEYHYHIWNAPVMNPLMRHHAWHVSDPLDQSAMQQAATKFVGLHDFRAFTSKREGVLGDSFRNVICCEISSEDSHLTMKIVASGFLYKMCRCIVGTLVEIGKGRIDHEKIDELLEGAPRKLAGMNAPAHGLILMRVSYHHHD